MIDIIVNGENRQVDEGQTVAGLLEDLRIVPERVVVELNGTILKRACFPDTALPAEARVEIIQFVGGG